jgi:hypothetical protein
LQHKKFKDMIANTAPSLVFDTTILENGIIKIPELKKWQNHDIHVVIVFKEAPKSSVTQTASLAGRLKKYANPGLIDRETELAWSNLTEI